MCAIFGCVLAWGVDYAVASKRVRTIFELSRERGRDGAGWRVRGDGAGPVEHRIAGKDTFNRIPAFIYGTHNRSTIIGNLRAEPTTEYVKDKVASDQQPYRVGKWTIVHNGTIANDKELRTNELETSIDSAAIAEHLDATWPPDQPFTHDKIAFHFAKCIEALKGSYAILATHDNAPGMIYAACNYRPIWFADSTEATYFASSRDYFPEGLVPQMVPPYSCWAFSHGYREQLDAPITKGRKALVVCSGGMDSVVAARVVQAGGNDVHLLHFQYGSRAEGPEDAAIHAVASAMEVPLHILPMAIYDPGDSPLLQADSTIAGGEAGAEFAHEWVPARNLVMLSLATAYAEAKGFDTIVLGNNLEEAGAYPDNEPEFINRFNDMLPFAVGDGKRLNVVMPVGNLMKHEIVALGTELGAPMGLTWSCYRAGALHCGTCGPCFMRRTAYEINNLEDPLQYAEGGE